MWFNSLSYAEKVRLLKVLLAFIIFACSLIWLLLIYGDIVKIAEYNNVEVSLMVIGFIPLEYYYQAIIALIFLSMSALVLLSVFIKTIKDRNEACRMSRDSGSHSWRRDDL